MGRRLPTALVAAGLAVAAPLPARAELVDVDYEAPGDGLVMRDTATGLEWLDPVRVGTLSLSASDFRREWGPSGFHRARAEEICALFAGNGFPVDPCPGTAFEIDDLAPAERDVLSAIVRRWTDSRSGFAAVYGESPAIFLLGVGIKFGTDVELKNLPEGSSPFQWSRPMTPLPRWWGKAWSWCANRGPDGARAPRSSSR